LAREPRSFDVKALWPRTTVATAAVENMLGGESVMRRSRKPEIVADAAYAIFNRDARRYTGRFVLDEDVLREEGRQSFAEYQVDPTQALEPHAWHAVAGDPGAGWSSGLSFGGDSMRGQSGCHAPQRTSNSGWRRERTGMPTKM